MKSPANKLLRATASAFGLARKTTNVEAIEAAMVEARAMIAEGDREEAEAAGRYRDALLSDDGDPADFLAAQQTAKIKRDRGEAQLTELTARLETVRGDAEQERRRVAYESAEAKAEAARVALVQQYPAIARDFHGLMRTVAEAEIAVVEANGELPAGAAPLVSPEFQVRSPAANLPPLPAAVQLKLWAPVGGGDPLPDADQHRVRAGIRGIAWKGTLERDDGSTLECHLRTFEKSVKYELPFGDDYSNLAGSASLPPLYPFTPPLWPQNLLRGMTFNRSDDVTLSILTEIEPLSSPAWRRQEGEIKTRARFTEIGRPVEADKFTVDPRRAPDPPPRAPSAREIREANTPSNFTGSEESAA